MLTDITVLLDRSGSMQSGREDHEGGLRSFVQEQLDDPGDTTFTFIRFDSGDPCEIVIDGKPIADVNLEDLKLVPRGGTPLLDAFGKAIAHTSERIANTNPDAVLFVCITDGGENQSREWTLAQIQQRVKELSEQKKRPWVFYFLGANPEAFSGAGQIGTQSAVAMQFQNTRAAYSATAKSAGRVKLGAIQAEEAGEELTSGGLLGLAAYTEEERKDAAGGESSGS